MTTERRGAELLLSFGRRLGRISWRGRCLPSNCSGQPRSLRTIPIIAKVRHEGLGLPFDGLPPLSRGERAGAAAGRSRSMPRSRRRAPNRRPAEAEPRASRKDARQSAGRGGPPPAQNRRQPRRRIEAAEARITASDAQFRAGVAYVVAHRARLRSEQGPVSSLLAGLAVMGPAAAAADARRPWWRRRAREDQRAARFHVTGDPQPGLAALSAPARPKVSALKGDARCSRRTPAKPRRRSRQRDNSSLSSSNARSGQRLPAGGRALERRRRRDRCAASTSRAPQRRGGQPLRLGAGGGARVE